MNTQLISSVASSGLRFANLVVSGVNHLGVQAPDGIIDITAAGQALSTPSPQSIDDLLHDGKVDQVQGILSILNERTDVRQTVLRDPETVIFGPIVHRPEKILCVGFNYQKHAAETHTPEPKAPPLFAKFWNCLNHHNGTVVLPAQIDSYFDYETELVIVIGKECKDVSEADALNHVAGYTIGNDISARARQTATAQLLAGKMADGWAPIGPWLVSASLVPNPNNLRLQTTLNGAKKQDWNTGDMIHDCRKIISYVSSGTTLNPGDVIFTGTPHGVIWGETAPMDQRRWLRDGDVVVSKIEGLGELQVHFAESGSSKSKLPAKASSPQHVDKMMAFDGGEAHVDDISTWSPGVNVGQPYVFCNNVYLIQHGESYMIWDTGVDDRMEVYPDGKVMAHGVRGVVTTPLIKQMQESGIDPDKITHIAFSHGHFDHVGNSRYFRNATWIVQEDEHQAMFGDRKSDFGFIHDLYKEMEDNLVIFAGEKYDIFGDGSVVIHRTRGHTPGHQSLLVRLPKAGPVLLSGDVAHFQENFHCCRVPKFNIDQKASKESMVKVRNLLESEGAKLWINHDKEMNNEWPHAPEWIV